MSYSLFLIDWVDDVLHMLDAMGSLFGISLLTERPIVKCLVEVAHVDPFSFILKVCVKANGSITGKAIGVRWVLTVEDFSNDVSDRSIKNKNYQYSSCIGLSTKSDQNSGPLCLAMLDLIRC